MSCFHFTPAVCEKLFHSRLGGPVRAAACRWGGHSAPARRCAERGHAAEAVMDHQLGALIGKGFGWAGRWWVLNNDDRRGGFFFGFGMMILMGLCRIVSLIAFQRINHSAAVIWNQFSPLGPTGGFSWLSSVCFGQQEHKQRSFVSVHKHCCVA